MNKYDYHDYGLVQVRPGRYERCDCRKQCNPQGKYNKPKNQTEKESP